MPDVTICGKVCYNFTFDLRPPVCDLGNGWVCKGAIFDCYTSGNYYCFNVNSDVGFSLLGLRPEWFPAVVLAFVVVLLCLFVLYAKLWPSSKEVDIPKEETKQK